MEGWKVYSGMRVVEMVYEWCSGGSVNSLATVTSSRLVGGMV